jgi:Type II CAAX prenyl endopeptidase Rce1-like
MSTATSQVVISAGPAEPSVKRGVAALEVLAVFAGILLFIWRWQYSHPYSWMALLAVVLASHVAHRDTLRALGLGVHDLRPCAQVIIPLAVLFFLPALVYGVASGRIAPALPHSKTLHYFGDYLLWCVFQQSLTQSFFHHRLMGVVENRHVSSLLVGLMFGAAHIPNLVLMAVTTLGGFALAEVFARHRNIWPLSLAQAVGGALVAALFPAALIHNMRVGPGYFFYGQP